MKTMHTPGPWRVADHEGEEQRAVIGPDNELIADCYAPTREDLNLPQDYRDNARLIAKAPKLLKALERLLNAAEGFDSLYDDESRAEAYRAELRELSKAKDQARAALS